MIHVESTNFEKEEVKTIGKSGSSLLNKSKVIYNSKQRPHEPARHQVNTESYLPYTFIYIVCNIS